MSLRDRILSDENIYNSIYCMESYVFEKGLLDKKSLKLYYKLTDKFNFEIIRSVIERCRNRIVRVLDNPADLFEVKVYFKIKKWDDEESPGRMKFRPLHTARLIDQICMVSMLLPLMFDDNSFERKRSELTKIIPHNFFGNIPCSNVEFLFKPWQKQYKTYSDTIIEHCKEYKQNNRYRTEISLDIKNFFPTISPEFIFNYVCDKLSFTYESDEDRKTLKIVLTKLLFFKLDKGLLQGWEANYYGKEIDIPEYSQAFSRGIAQGLPQSYLFGNLCMIEVRDRIMDLEEFKSADSYFYVDDSVIYIEKDIKNQEEFNSIIREINESIADIGQYQNPFLCFVDLIYSDALAFQQKLTYKIQFHDYGKSDYCNIENAGSSNAGLEHLIRNVSMASSIYSNMDETEDEYSRDKLEKIKSLIDDEIARLKKIRANTIDSDSDEESVELISKQVAGRLKMLKRYKRFYLYRLKFLERRLDDCDTDSDCITDFCVHFGIEYKILDSSKVVISEKQSVDVPQWMDSFDEDIFQSEARMLISMLPYENAKNFVTLLKNFEICLTADSHGNANALFFQQDFDSTLRLKSYSKCPYYSLSRVIRKYNPPKSSLSSSKQKDKFEEFAHSICNLRKNVTAGKKTYTDTKLTEFIPPYTWFVFLNSDEYTRIILNCYYSIQNEIEPNDSKTFTKYSPRGLHYTELRILSRLRNHNFKLGNFVRALEDIDATDLDNRMNIDMGLLEVMNILITNVHNPDLVDNIILTHRVVKGLWYNGSKFMNSYTLHNEEHAVTLIKASVKLIKAIDYLNIKQTDYYILFLACYLHDISMVIHPNLRNFSRNDDYSNSIISDFLTVVRNKNNKELYDDNPEVLFKKAGHFLIKQFEAIYGYFSDSIRNIHPQESANYIRLWKDTILKHLAPVILSHVAKVSESHGWDSSVVYGLKSDAKCSLVSEKYTMILIRLADLMDVANDRINYNLLRQNVSHMGEVSKFHWISHLITDEIRIAPTYETDENKEDPIQNRQIIERLNFNLFLNVKFIAAIKGTCKKCRYQAPLDTKIVKLQDEHKTCEGIMLNMFEIHPPDTKGCPVLCKWTMKKHEWLINELVELNKYLNSVNDQWFKTQIRLNIIYRDEYHLESDLYDNVLDYLNKN